MTAVVACCAGLHNLALLNGDIVEPEDEEDHDDFCKSCFVSVSGTNAQ